MTDSLIVLSLFDGIGCARMALGRAGLPVSKYYSSEIDKNALAVAEKNFPATETTAGQTIQLGDVRAITAASVPDKVDLLIGGSPCQDMSVAKHGREGLKGSRSCLFYEFLRLRDELKPRFFCLENVASMRNTDRQAITEAIGVPPMMIDAKLLSAQSRRRLFWVGRFEDGRYVQVDIPQPQDRGILLKDILEKEVDQSFYVLRGMEFPAKEAANSEGQGLVFAGGVAGTKDWAGDDKMLSRNFQPGNRVYSDEGKALAISANPVGQTGGATPLYMTRSGYQTNDSVPEIGQAKRVYGEGGKSPPPNSWAPLVRDVNGHKEIWVKAENGKTIRLPVDNDLAVFKEVRTEEGKRLRREGRLTTGEDHTKRDANSKEYVTVSGEKANCVTTGLNAEHYVAIKTDIRRLTPIECERLMSLPDNYTEGISKAQRYKVLGNGFSVAVVEHILRSIKLSSLSG